MTSLPDRSDSPDRQRAIDDLAWDAEPPPGYIRAPGALDMYVRDTPANRAELERHEIPSPSEEPRGATATAGVDPCEGMAKPAAGDASDSPHGSNWLGEELLGHQAHISIVYLYDHGWQVSLSNPGGSLYVHGCEVAEKWPKDGGPTLPDTITKAIDRAKAEGWW